MLNIEKIKNGVVIDHIRAGQGLKIFNWLGLDKAGHTVAFVVNAISRQHGRKDIIKIDNTISLDFAVLGLIDPDITVNIIENEKVIKKIHLKLPDKVENILVCKNPRCISTSEAYATQIFHLVDVKKGIYRCEYCDDVRSKEDFK